MVAIIYHKNLKILKILLLFIFKKMHTEFIFNIINKHKAKKIINMFDLICKMEIFVVITKIIIIIKLIIKK